MAARLMLSTQDCDASLLSACSVYDFRPDVLCVNWFVNFMILTGSPTVEVIVKHNVSTSCRTITLSSIIAPRGIPSVSDAK